MQLFTHQNIITGISVIFIVLCNYLLIGSALYQQKEKVNPSTFLMKIIAGLLLQNLFIAGIIWNRYNDPNNTTLGNLLMAGCFIAGFYAPYIFTYHPVKPYDSSCECDITNSLPLK